MVLNQEELEQRQNGAVDQVVDLLCVPRPEATRVLRFYKW
jgi:hypothetical protein